MRFTPQPVYENNTLIQFAQQFNQFGQQQAAASRFKTFSVEILNSNICCLSSANSA